MSIPEDSLANVDAHLLLFLPILVPLSFWILGVTTVRFCLGRGIVLCHVAPNNIPVRSGSLTAFIVKLDTSQTFF